MAASSSHERARGASAHDFRECRFAECDEGVLGVGQAGQVPFWFRDAVVRIGTHEDELVVPGDEQRLLTAVFFSETSELEVARRTDVDESDALQEGA